MTDADPHLARIRVYPVKSLDPDDRARARVLRDGGLTDDRAYAIRDADGRYVNGKREPAVHGIDASFDTDGHELALRERRDRATGTLPAESFFLADERGRDAAADWLSTYFGYPVTLDHDGEGGFPDDTTAHGPTVVSTATLAAVGDWFDLDTESVRRRFRPTLEVGGVPAFWEDRLYVDHERVVRVRIGDAEFLGTNPCSRCAVPSRDPDTGDAIEGFRETFVERREATRPAWASEAWFDHHYRLAVNTAVPEATVGATLAVGDTVEILDVEDGNPQS
ncbi:MOSC domain-containing protein [Halarchaeum salinum]|uniref:MOSC domain-containing protein n=1 Tax=Halarchaeum salinum TaxID=489912 RepID=A0AAV3SB20_9EURY